VLHGGPTIGLPIAGDVVVHRRLHLQADVSKLLNDKSEAIDDIFGAPPTQGHTPRRDSAPGELPSRAHVRALATKNADFARLSKGQARLIHIPP